MNQQKTLGERIKYHRKRLGLTQEELAKRMGVSAQAVSKWENNLSCPDISVLPELAEVFDITLDELLGREAQPGIVHEAVPAEEEKEKSEGWSWNWNIAEKKVCSALFALFVMIYGGLLLLNNVLELDVSWWTPLWTLSIVFAGACGLCYKFSFFNLIMVLAGGFFLLDAYELFRFDLGWGMLIPGVLILWALSLMVDLILGKKKKKPLMSVHYNKNDSEPRCEFTCDDGWFKCEQNFGEERVPVVTPLLRGGEIDSNFGNFFVDFSGCEAVAPDCKVVVDNSFCSLTLLVPERFRVKMNAESNFAPPASVEGSPCADPKGTLYFEIDNSFGHVAIKYV